MVAQPHPLTKLMIAQQPVIDEEGNTAHIELFFQRKRGTPSIEGSKDAINQRLISICLGVSELKEEFQAPLSIKLTSAILMSDIIFPIDPKLIYIELPGNTAITRSSVNALKKWRNNGYKFILSGYRFDIDYRHILPYIHMVKMDATKLIENKQRLDRLKASKMPIIVRKIDSQKAHEICKKLGATHFQGDYFKALEQIEKKGASAEMKSAKLILGELSSESASLDKVTQLISDNPYLSYQLLRILNNPISGLPRKITDIREAIIMVGLELIKRWASLISLSASKKQQNEIFSTIINRSPKVQSE
ncbi:Intracellular signaling protein (EAL-mHD-GYP) [Marinomonas sp. MED121]|uniref:EAL and HDOD domain-containing protein n=1 Tax=Marinomonas sp. MED121 TaxID=314277 RepID=UPI000068FBD5|nr:HDOD domain-containing protein [Marinomonas sp. MED121]EAQ63785.1 Intracellular signaling protein (EAL-mHD-GYP) [Marinomonas sp. MED121]